MTSMIAILHQYPLLWWSYITLVGLVIGSFLNVVIYRLPLVLHRSWKKQCLNYLATQNILLTLTPSSSNKPFNLITPCSTCPHCKTPIAAYDNIPILSFLLLKGRCRHCQEPISWRYPLVELLTSIATLLVVHQFPSGSETIGALLLTYALITLTFIDLDHQLLPDEITLGMLWLGLLWPLLTGVGILEARLLGAALGYAFLYSIYVGFKCLTGKEGMGHGDFKLLAMLGAWLGFKVLPQLILISSAMGAIVGILLLLRKKMTFGKPMPFGPYLAIAGWIALTLGPRLEGLCLS